MKTSVILVVGIALLLGMASASSRTSTPLGYAWAKKDVLVPVPSDTKFRQLSQGGEYPIIGQVDAGYLMLVETIDGYKCPALVPFRDRMGNSTEKGHFAGIEDAKPGFFPLKAGQVMTVYEEKGAFYMVTLDTGNGLTSRIEIPQSAVSFLSIADYEKQRVAEEQRARAASEAERRANRQARIDEQAAFEAERRARELKRTQFIAEQKAKGLVLFNDQWLRPEQVAQSERAAAEAKQEAGRSDAAAKAELERQKQQEAEERAGRVGGTKEQFVEKFGKPELTRFPFYEEALSAGTRDIETEYFKKSGLLIIAYFHKKIATQVEYFKLRDPSADIRRLLGDDLRPGDSKRAVALTDDEIALLMANNGGRREWKENGTAAFIHSYKTKDGKLSAQVWRPRDIGFLIILDEQLTQDKSKAASDAQNNITNAQERQRLKKLEGL